MINNNNLTIPILVFSISISLYFISLLFGFTTRNINRKSQGLDK